MLVVCFPYSICSLTALEPRSQEVVSVLLIRCNDNLLTGDLFLLLYLLPVLQLLSYRYVCPELQTVVVVRILLGFSSAKRV